MKMPCGSTITIKDYERKKGYTKPIMTTRKDKKQLGHKFCLQIHTILQTQKSYLVSSILKTLGIIKLDSCSIGAKSDSCSTGANVTKILKNPMDQLKAPFLPPPQTQPSKVLPNTRKFSTSSHQDLHKSPLIIEIFAINIGFALSI